MRRVLKKIVFDVPRSGLPKRKPHIPQPPAKPVRQTVIVPHSPNCWAVEKYGGDWYLVSSEFLRRDRIHRSRHDRTNLFVVFKCNDASCPARMIVLEDDLHKAAGIEGR